MGIAGLNQDYIAVKSPIFDLDTKFEAFLDQVQVGSVSSLTHRGELVFSLLEMWRCWAHV